MLLFILRLLNYGFIFAEHTLFYSKLRVADREELRNQIYLGAEKNEN